MLEAAHKVAGTETMRGRLTQNIEIAKNNFEHRTCHYCRLRQKRDEAAVEVPMYGNVRRTLVGREYVSEGTHTQYRVEWQNVTVHVPRCHECKRKHAAVRNWTLGSGVSGIAIAVLAFWAGGTLGGNAGGAIGFLGFLCLIGGFVLGHVIGRSERARQHEGQHRLRRLPRDKGTTCRRLEEWKGTIRCRAEDGSAYLAFVKQGLRESKPQRITRLANSRGKYGDSWYVRLITSAFRSEGVPNCASYLPGGCG